MSAPTRGGIFDLLVPDERERRPIDETLADWREERCRARGLSRLIVDIRSLSACVRVSAGSVGAPYRGIAMWRYLLFSLVAAVGIGMLVTIDLLVRWPFGLLTSTQVWLLLVPTSAMLALVITAAAGVGLRRGQRLPLLSAAVGLVAVFILLHGWVVPESNQRFRQTVLTAFGSQPAVLLGRGTAELTLPMLLRDLGSADEFDRTRAARTLTRKAAQTSLFLAVVALGEAIRRRLPRRWRWWIVQAASGAISVGLAVGLLAATAPARSSLPGPIELSVPPFHLDWFAAAAVVLLLTAWLSRRAAQSRTSHQNPHPGTSEPRHPGTLSGH